MLERLYFAIGIFTGTQCHRCFIFLPFFFNVDILHLFLEAAVLSVAILL